MENGSARFEKGLPQGLEKAGEAVNEQHYEIWKHCQSTSKVQADS